MHGAARRAQLRELLERHGYRFEWALRDQDWYVLDDRGRGSGEQAAAPLQPRRSAGLGAYSALLLAL